ncbi:MAG: GEVED domain-containing protein [Planctomycetota bacterium]|jgi:hypothetical protein
MKRLRSKLLLACMSILLLCGSNVALGVSNDDCSNAEPIGDVVDKNFETREATFDGAGRCMTSPNIWYCYTASCTGTATVSLLGSGYDTMLAVYDGCECDASMSDGIECNDDFEGNLQSQISFPVIAGRKYLIEVGGYASDVGSGVLSVDCVRDPSHEPQKDECAGAEAVGDVKDLPFSTTGMTFDGPGLCMTSPNIWFCYTATCTGDVTVSLAGSAYDTMLAVYNGCDCYPNQDDLIECNDDFESSFQSQITFAAVEGNNYLIEIGGFSSDTGDGVLNISCEPQVAPKDDCVGAEPVGDVKNLPFSTRGMTFDGPGLCMTSPNIWFCYTATCTGDATVSLLGSGYDTMLAVYKSCECYPTEDDLIACNDDVGGIFQSQVTFPVVAGGKYLIEVGGYASETGDGVLNISCEGKAGTVGPDLGDAPDSTNNSGTKVMSAYPSRPGHFPTVYDDGSGVGPYGPAHINEIAVAFLGKVITGETEADKGLDEDGKNNLRPAANSANDDSGDDAIELPLALPNCGWATFDYEVTVIDPNVDLWVNVWFDFNRDGDWDDMVECPGGPVPEWAVQNQFLFDLPAGPNEVTTPGFRSVHPEGTDERIWMRITLSEQPWTGGSNPGELGNAGSGPIEKYEIGETEDYFFIPDVPDDKDCPLCEDVNGDGVIDLDDLSDFTAQWLETCL